MNKKDLIERNRRRIINNKINVVEGLVSDHAITLISLVITIILLIILAGVVIHLSIGQNGIFNRVNQAKEMYEKNEAREKLETVLIEAAIEKEINVDYNLDTMIEQKDMTVNGDYVIVDNYTFLIDREKLKIVESLGETEIKITKEVQKYIGKNENGKYEVEALLIIEGNTALKSVEIEKTDGTKIQVSTEKLILTKDITLELDEEYKITVITEDGKTESRKIVEKSHETISSEKELADFRDKVNSGLTYEGKTITLTKDLDLRSVCNEENSWEPIGGFNYEVEGNYNAFSGIFNGNNHIIDYLYIDTDSELSQGLFGYTLNSTITGVIIGEHSSINSSIRLVGGIVGYAINSAISYCGNNGTVIGPDCIGGIVATLDSGEITACYNNGTISGSSDCVGGICGNAEVWLYEGENKINIIQYSYNTGTISGSENIGGICGYPSAYARVENCYNKGNISGVRSFGGIVGQTEAKNYTNKQNWVRQEIAKAQISYTCNIGKVNSEGTRIGGICGYNTRYSTIKNNYILKGTIDAERDIGTSSIYLGKYVGQAYSTSTSYIGENAEITNQVNTENITDTVYYIVNGMDEGESQYWAKDNVTQPKLKWELE